MNTAVKLRIVWSKQVSQYGVSAVFSFR